MIYVILGMHKSGTTLLARILHHSGINMGHHDKNQSYDRGNQYERASVAILNKKMLGVKNDRIIRLATPHNLHPTPTEQAIIRQIIRHGETTYKQWGFKDPRTCLTYPVWAAELPPHKLLVVHRPFEEIWPRFYYDGVRLYHANPLLAWLYINRWCEHNLNIIRYLNKTDRPYLVLSYQALMQSDEEFARLEQFIGQPLNDQRQKKLYRGRNVNSRLLTLMSRLFQWRYGYHPHDLTSQLETLRAA